jgi:tetratricopeptide (TPR) repeat protein
MIAFKTNDRTGAERLWLEGLQRTPGDPFILSHIYALTGEPRYKDQLFRYFDDIDADFYLGAAFLECGKPATAAEYLARVTGSLPDYRRGLFYLGAALSRCGRFTEAAAKFKAALAIRPDPVLFGEEMISSFSRVAEQSPADWRPLYEYGQVLSDFGRYSEALEVQNKALKLSPGQAELKKAIEGLKKIPEVGAPEKSLEHPAVSR